MSLSYVIAPRSRLSQLLLKHNLKNPVYVLEYCENIVTNRRPEAQSVKKTLNSVSGVYLCINLVNGNMYVGSAYLNNMFRRFRGHLYLAAGGSKIVNNSVLKYFFFKNTFFKFSNFGPGYTSDSRRKSEVRLFLTSPRS